jgi:DNA-binding beta-propeller fold protein YncE
MRLLKLFILFGLFVLSLMACAAPPPEKKPVELYWPLPPDKPRIKFIASYHSERDLKPPARWLEALVGPDRTKALRRPYFALSDDEGNIYVSDPEQSAVFKFEIKKKRVSIFAQLAVPLGMDIIHSKGILLVADGKAKVVYGFRLRDGSPAMGISSKFKRPVAVRVDEKNRRIYVADSARSDIQVFDLNGRYVSTIGRRGMGKGEFLLPLGIDVDSKGRIYVADAFNYRVQVLDKDGNYITTIGYGIGRKWGNFDKLKSVALDSEDHIYALDASHSNVQIFDIDNNLYMFFGSPGSREGQFFIPTGIYIDDKDYIYIADSLNRRVQVFKYLGSD